MVPASRRPAGSHLPSLKRLVGSSEFKAARTVCWPEAGSRSIKEKRPSGPDNENVRCPFLDGTTHPGMSSNCTSTSPHLWIRFPWISTQYKVCVLASHVGPSPSFAFVSKSNSVCILEPIPFIKDKCCYGG